MKFTHNLNNDWRDECKTMGVDKMMINYIGKVIKDEINKFYESICGESFCLDTNKSIKGKCIDIVELSNIDRIKSVNYK